MKRLSWVVALLCSAFAAGCSASDTEEDLFFVTPEDVIAIPEDGGAYDYYIGMLDAPDDMVVVSAQSLDPAKAKVSFENGGSSIILPAGQEKRVRKTRSYKGADLPPVGKWTELVMSIEIKPGDTKHSFGFSAYSTKAVGPQVILFAKPQITPESEE